MRREIGLVVLGIILFIVYFIVSKLSILNSGFIGGFILGVIQAGGFIAILDAVILHIKRRKKA